jgi:gamma-glutamyltranspeptidase/glutathione hydrolase
VLVVAAPGASRIVTAILQVILNVLDFGMTPTEAVAAPRFDFQGEVLELEGRVPSDTVVALMRLGYRVNRRLLHYDGYFARPQVIAYDPETELWRGASDPRKDGGVAMGLA